MDTAEHLKHFSGRCSLLISEGSYRRYFEGRENIGRFPDANDPNGSIFVATAEDIDKAIAESNGDISKVEDSLGLPRGQLGSGPIYRVDIEDPESLNLRVANGKEAGANMFFNTKLDGNGKLPDIKTTADGTVDTNATDPGELAKLNGRYTDQDGTEHPPNLEGYDGRTSGGLREAVVDQVPNNAKNITYTKMDGFGNGESGNISAEKVTDGYAPKDPPQKKNDGEFRAPNLPTQKTGTFLGERGNSDFIPNSEKAQAKLKEYGTDHVTYKNGYPDFSPFTHTRDDILGDVYGEVGIGHMTEDRANPAYEFGHRSNGHAETEDLGNFAQADNELAKKMNAQNGTNLTGKDIQDYRERNGLTWHEKEDGKTMQLIPREIHDGCRHSGGVATMKDVHSIAGADNLPDYDDGIPNAMDYTYDPETDTLIPIQHDPAPASNPVDSEQDVPPHNPPPPGGSSNVPPHDPPPPPGGSSNNNTNGNAPPPVNPGGAANPKNPDDPNTDKMQAVPDLNAPDDRGPDGAMAQAAPRDSGTPADAAQFDQDPGARGEQVPNDDDPNGPAKPSGQGPSEPMPGEPGEDEPSEGQKGPAEPPEQGPSEPVPGNLGEDEPDKGPDSPSAPPEQGPSEPMPGEQGQNEPGKGPDGPSEPPEQGPSELMPGETGEDKPGEGPDSPSEPPEKGSNEPNTEEPGQDKPDGEDNSIEPHETPHERGTGEPGQDEPSSEGTPHTEKPTEPGQEDKTGAPQPHEKGDSGDDIPNAKADKGDSKNENADTSDMPNQNPGSQNQDDKTDKIPNKGNGALDPPANTNPNPKDEKNDGDPKENNTPDMPNTNSGSSEQSDDAAVPPSKGTGNQDQKSADDAPDGQDAGEMPNSNVKSDKPSKDPSPPSDTDSSKDKHDDNDRKL